MEKKKCLVVFYNKSKADWFESRNSISISDRFLFKRISDTQGWLWATEEQIKDLNRRYEWISVIRS